MIIGIFLGLSLAVLIVSTFFFLYGIIHGFEESILTAAVTGTEGIISYSVLGIVFSLIVVVLFIMILKSRRIKD